MIKYLLGLAAVLHLSKRARIYLLKRRLKNGHALKIIEGADTFFLKNDDLSKSGNILKRGNKSFQEQQRTGVLLLHGFTSTTDEFKEMGKYLHQKGFTVYCPLLSGHGTIKEHLYCINPKDWLFEVSTAIKKLEECCDSIYLVGCSFGGNLAILSANQSEKIKGIVTLGTPFIFRGDPLARILVFLIKPFKLFRKKHQTKKILEVYKKNKRISYKELPLEPLSVVFKMIEQSKKILPTMKKDILFIQAHNDHIFNEKNIDYAYHRVGSARKEICLVHDTIHVFIMDNKGWKVYEEVENFMTRKCPALPAI